MSTVPFADRLSRRIEELGSPLCVGIDPVLGRIPHHIRQEAAGRHGATERGAAAALYAFGAAVVEAVSGRVPAVKLQSAFFEAYGPPGVAAFWDLVRYARQQGLLIIADAKRGDIGSTAEAYADAFLGHAAPIQSWGDPSRFADALTVNPYLGTDSLRPLAERAAALGRGLFVLVKTSNPSAGDLQDRPLAPGPARDGRGAGPPKGTAPGSGHPEGSPIGAVLSEGATVATHVARLVQALGAQYLGASGFSAVGAVVGATYPQDLARLRALLPRTFLLVPGLGAQGAGPADVAPAFLPGGRGALVAASRSVIYSFSSEHVGPAELRAAIREAAEETSAQLRAPGNVT